MVSTRNGRNASVLACVALVACKSKGRTAVDSGPPEAAVTATVTSADASAAASAQRSPVTVARGARAFVAAGRSRYALVAPDGSSWRVDALSRAGEATLGTETRHADHAVLVPDKDGAVVALTLLDDRSGGIYRFAPEGDPTMLIDG